MHGTLGLARLCDERWKNDIKNRTVQESKEQKFNGGLTTSEDKVSLVHYFLPTRLTVLYQWTFTLPKQKNCT